MPGFVRRFTSFPSISTLAEIEGIDIVDLIPPGIFLGVQTGTLGLVGEWPRGPFEPTSVDGERTIDTTYGGFSLSIADPLSFSSGSYTNPFSNGNAFAWLKNKRFNRLVLQRVNMDLAEGVAVQLTASGTVAATGSITTIVQANISDGETFTLNDGINAAITFEFDQSGTNTPAPGNVEIDISGDTSADDVASSIETAINGVAGILLITASASTNTVSLTNDNGGAQGNQVITETVSDTGFIVAGMAGGTGATVLTSAITLPAGIRVRDASAPNVEFALSRDVTFASGTSLITAGFTAYSATATSYATRTVSGVPVYSTRNTPEAAVGDVDSADAQDLLRGGFGVGSANPTFVISVSTGAVDGSTANTAVLTPLTSAVIDTRYESAINALSPGDATTDPINIVASARQSSAIRSALVQNATDSSSVGVGRIALLRPPIGTTLTSAVTDTDPGVGANRSDRAVYCVPHFRQRVAEISILDPNETIAGEDILVGADAAMATLVSLLEPETNPGQSTQGDFPGGLLNFIQELERGLTGGANDPTRFTLQNYTTFRAEGIAALRRSPQLNEWVFQSGVTAIDPAISPQLRDISRRRMADFIQDSLAAIALRYNKLPRTASNTDSLLGELTDFLETLLSANNPSQQRIADFSVDGRTGNTLALQEQGIFVVQIEVQLLGTLDKIVLQTTIGAGVEVRVEEI